MTASRLVLFACAAALAVLAAACAGGAAPRPVPPPGPPAPTPAPRPLVFPDDELAHDERLEWWYYSGHLETADGDEYGFHFVIFQSLASPGGGGAGAEASYAAQFSLVDPASGRHFQGARFDVAPRPRPGDALELTVGGWELSAGPPAHALAASLDGVALSLILTPTKPPALHNEIGWLAGPTSGWTYYYSWPRMAAEGVLTLGGEPRAVTGQVWMDHQWGDFFVVGHPAGWQWLALQLDDGTEIMVTESRGTDGAVAATYGSLIGQDGSVTALRPGDAAIQLEALGTWTSPHTGAIYPQGWRLRIPSHDIDLELAPVLQDQEITSARPVSAIYWEGEVSVSGASGGRPVSGAGYVELAGYVVPPPLPWRVP